MVTGFSTILQILQNIYIYKKVYPIDKSHQFISGYFSFL